MTNPRPDASSLPAFNPINIAVRAIRAILYVYIAHLSLLMVIYLVEINLEFILQNRDSNPAVIGVLTHPIVHLIFLFVGFGVFTLSCVLYLGCFVQIVKSHFFITQIRFEIALLGFLWIHCLALAVVASVHLRLPGQSYGHAAVLWDLWRGLGIQLCFVLGAAAMQGFCFQSRTETWTGNMSDYCWGRSDSKISEGTELREGGRKEAASRVD